MILSNDHFLLRSVVLKNKFARLRAGAADECMQETFPIEMQGMLVNINKAFSRSSEAEKTDAAKE